MALNAPSIMRGRRRDDFLVGLHFRRYHRRRDHGGVIFIDLRDREGLVQVVCDPDRADVFKNAEAVRNEFCLRITGIVRLRPEGTSNAIWVNSG